MAACFEVTCAWFPATMHSIHVITHNAHTQLLQGGLLQDGLHLCLPHCKSTEGLHWDQRKCSHLTHTALATSSSSRGWRLEDAAPVVRAGRGREQQSYLHPANQKGFFNIVREEFHFVKFRSQFNVTRSKFILLALIYN